MPTLLSNKEVELLAKELSASPKAVTRILGSQRITFSFDSSLKQQLQLGLNLLAPEFFIGMDRKNSLQQLRSIALSYQKHCPKIVNWLKRGDFQPFKPPSQLDKALVIHACRTASRLHAEALRAKAEYLEQQLK